MNVKYAKLTDGLIKHNVELESQFEFWGKSSCLKIKIFLGQQIIIESHGILIIHLYIKLHKGLHSMHSLSLDLSLSS